MFKYFCLLILLFCFIFTQYVMINAVQPEVTTSLALEQFANPTVQTDTMSRLFNATNIFPWLYTIWTIVFGVSVYKDFIEKENE